MSEKISLAARFNKAQSELVTQTADLPLGTLAQMVEEGSIDLTPGFQRRERWKPEHQSALIESFLLNVPVPPIYLAEEVDGRYTAIDGKQRLKAISDFIYGRFRLTGLDNLVQAEGRTFEDLPGEILNALRLRPYLRVVTLLKQTDDRLKYEVFLRLNRGGESLNQQEIRNVAFRGPLNDEIYKASENAFLRQQLKIGSDKSQAYRQMQDAEYVLRFLALTWNLDDFRGSLVHQMDRYMIENEGVSQQQAVELVRPFRDAILRCQSIWGDRAFKRPDGTGWRDQMLAGLYDAQMLSIVSLSDEQFNSATERRQEVVEQTRTLFQDDEFDKSVRAGTNTPARIRYRVQKTKEILVGALQ
ncbi:Protein of unknown function DUF262 [Tranquillimonas rosea]|uniref:GmrSD restriction endonucleases N-terminal domain-containing protein n=1 Tax=Tranquillimonas rosea TaxID=641238 RepID=A0A1H9X4H8_9RHOB|nr:DUF262 domain-containing protein [Tranquillimonas rosea]SES41050.1 Protein of unknown function DUF262 [Tranquillimonas rosea]